MANTKISALGSGTTPQAADEFVIARAGANFKLTYAALFAAVPSITIDDANFGLDIVSSKPRITFDSGDYMEYDRTNNILEMPAGGLVRHTHNASSIGDTIRLANDANAADTGNKISFHNAAIATAAGYIAGRRVGATTVYALEFAVSPDLTTAAVGMTLTPTGLGIGAAASWGKLHVAGDIGAHNYYASGQATTDSAVYGFSNTNGPKLVAWGTASVGAGLLELKNPTQALITLTPTGAVLLIADAAFSLSKSGSNPLVTFDTADYMVYDRAANSLNVAIGGTVMFQFSGGALVQYNAGVPSYWMVNSSLGANLKVGRIVLSTQDFIFSKFNDDFVTNTTLATITSNGQVRGNSGTPFGTTTTATNGAAAATGTLTNAPAAGNPTKWMPFYDNGTTRYIPMW